MEGNLRRRNGEGTLRRGKGRRVEDREGAGEKSMLSCCVHGLCASGEKTCLKIPCDCNRQQGSGEQRGGGGCVQSPTPVSPDTHSYTPRYTLVSMAVIVMMRHTCPQSVCDSVHQSGTAPPPANKLGYHSNQGSPS